MWADEAGDTMAQIRNRLDCSGACEPTMDIVFSDVWTDAGVRTPDPDINFLYDDLTTTQPMSDSTCDSSWHGLCRSVIHYEQHIHPLWSVTREVTDGMGTVIEDHTCIACHTDDDAGVDKVPDAQLNLTDAADENVPAHLAAYHELLDQTFVQILNADGVLEYQYVPVPDAEDGTPQPDVRVPVPGGPSMIAGNAAAGRFLGKFDVGGTHEGYLTEAEKKLIAEWLDIGAQYYNNPFDVPLD
jgi:hypothetical protein